jgi:hypothetical protein
VKTLHIVKEAEIIDRVVPLIEEALRAVPAVRDVQVEEHVGLGEVRVDVLARVRVKGGSAWVLVVEVKANGQPRWARSAAEHLTALIQAGDGERKGADHYGVFVAPYVSGAAAEVLWERGVGYLDLAGNGRLAFDGVYLERKGNPNRSSERSELRTLFSPKASRVLRILLMRPHEPWRMAALAEEADVSLGLVAKVKPLLLDREWADDTAEGLILTDPGSALDTWAEGFRRRRSEVRDYYGFGSLREIEERIAGSAEALGVRYALAEFSGAERLAPHVRYSRAAAYVGTDALEEVAKHAELRPVETGPNVRLFEPYDDGVFFRSERLSGAEVAHPIQLYLDLQKAKGRGEEAAAFLRRQVLEPMWTQRRQETSVGVAE